jgi:hypothetical protein
LECPYTVAADELLASVVEKVKVEADEVLSSLKGCVGFGVGVAGL